MDFLNRKSFSGVLLRVTALIILVPFFVISFFNHPIGDDYWATDLVRRMGFWRAQIELYNTVPPRWLDLILSSLMPLSWGNFWGYKVVPIVFFLLIIVAMAWFFRTLSGDSSFRRKDSYVLAILFTAIFLSAAPGIGRGVYWVSAVTVYGVGLLLFISWTNLLLLWYRGRRSGWILAGISACYLGMAGSNEIIAIVSLAVLGMINLYRIANRKGIDKVTVFMLIMVVLSVAFAACFKGVSNRYSFIHSSNSGRFWYSVGFSMLESGLCIFKVVTSPFCLAALIVAYDPFVRWGKGVYELYREELLNAAPGFWATWLFILIIIPFPILYLSGVHAPYRIVNMVFFFQLIGLMYFGLQAIHRWKAGTVTIPVQYRNIAVVVLLATGFVWKNNVSIATRELVSGSAYQYDREMNQRYQLILQCKSDTCVVPHLRHTSVTLRYDSADYSDFFHTSVYFHKRVIVR